MVREERNPDRRTCFYAVWRRRFLEWLRKTVAFNIAEKCFGMR
jgi:hypothetical protein